MEGGEKRNRNEPSRPGQCRETKDGSTQTDCRIQGEPDGEEKRDGPAALLPGNVSNLLMFDEPKRHCCLL